MEKRYRTLRFIATIYKIIGIISAIVTLASVVGVCGLSFTGGAAVDDLMNQMGEEPSVAGTFGGIVGGVFVSLLVLLSGGGAAIMSFAAGEGINLLIALEENTRQIAVHFKANTAG